MQISIAAFPRAKMAYALFGANGEGVAQGDMEATFGVAYQRLRRNIAAPRQSPLITDGTGKGVPQAPDQEEEDHQQEKTNQKPHTSPPLLCPPGSGKINCFA